VFTQSEVDNVKISVADLTAKVDGQNKRQDKTTEMLLASRRENSILKDKLIHLDTYIRRENLKFSGINEDKNETVWQCRRKMWDLFVNKLGIDYGNEIEFHRCHRLGPK
jgi:hypothetical protein